MNPDLDNDDDLSDYFDGFDGREPAEDGYLDSYWEDQCERGYEGDDF